MLSNLCTEHETRYTYNTFKRSHKARNRITDLSLQIRLVQYI